MISKIPIKNRIKKMIKNRIKNMIKNRIKKNLKVLTFFLPNNIRFSGIRIKGVDRLRH